MTLRLYVLLIIDGMMEDLLWKDILEVGRIEGGFRFAVQFVTPTKVGPTTTTTFVLFVFYQLSLIYP